MAAAVDTFSSSSSSAAAAAPTHQQDDVQAPSLSTTNALARFEYEAGKPSHDATKVLMVEWMDTPDTLNGPGQWHISWKDRHSVLTAEDPSVSETTASAARRKTDTHRMFFLLGPTTPIPPTVTLQFIPLDSSSIEPIHWQTYPLPAIFPPELGASAREAGKKGVLHTLWAKKRLSVLSKEIEDESKNNIEGVGLEMAIQEKDWIIQNFGVGSKPAVSVTKPTELRIPIPVNFESSTSLNSPQTPRSPGGGRLLEKMRGLKIGTSSNDWGRGIGIDTPPQTGGQQWQNPLSPETSDVAASGFEAIKGFQANRTTPPPAPQQQATARRMAPAAPPAEWRQMQETMMPSLASIAQNDTPLPDPTIPGTGLVTADDDSHDDELFQLPMSPRSPDHAKSPFSFAADDVAKYAKQIS